MNLYVGNLPFGTTEADLESAFGPYGQIDSVAIIRDKFSGQSRGFGFVEMPNPEEAKAAVEAMHGKDMGGRTITVNEARPRDERPARAGGGGGGGGYGGGGGGRSGGGGGGYGGGGGGGGGRSGGGGGYSDRRGGDRRGGGW